ncbi:Rid family detoxifying hydrolase [Alkalibacterium sp. MB6]|uniref:Rid family detoxifying hydrolase n=1 Tax=Alkalibacterium sp. MB6 TaxID=2081965 RepID=UPI00192A3224|nr:Rid family detoxifying hydrolase [Alkalibacterium sp. MB6]
MKKEKMTLESVNAPKAIGPYSQAVVHGSTIYVSGQLPIDAKEGRITGTTIKEQTEQSLKNIQYILAEHAMDLSNVLKATVLLSDINDFSEMNEVYDQYFSRPYPARAAYAVKDLPQGALVEIEVIAGS